MALYDVVAANRQATATGTALGQAMFSNSLRMQQLKSEQALQQLQQQQLAQRMAFDLQAHNMMIDQQAETAKAMAQVQLESQPFIPAPSGDRDMGQMIGPDGSPMGQPGMIPNPHYTPLDQSLMKNMLPVVAKYQPKEVDNFISSTAMLPYRLAEARRQNALADQATQGGMKPQAVVVRDPVTGKDRTMFQTGPNSWQLGQESASQRMFDRFTLEQQGKMLDEVRKTRLDLYNNLPTDERGNKYVPDNIVSEVAKKAGLTTQNITKLEGEEIGAENVFALGKELLPLINENTTGAKAEFKRFLQRRGITTLFPSLDDPQISVAEAVGQKFSAGVVRAMRSDSNIAKNEFDTLRHAAETINWTTMASGRAKLASIVKQAADTSRRAAQMKGTPINPLFLTKNEIKARLEAGDFGPTNTEEEKIAAAQAAKAAYDNTAENFLQSIPTQ